MDYRNLGWAGIKVSPLCLGTMMFGGPASEEDSIRMIHRAIDDGINFLDCANIYTGGESERVTGKAIRDRRDQVILATKGVQPIGQGPNDRGGSRVQLIRALEESLQRLGTDYVDIYYLHAYDYDTSLEESLGALNDLVTQGKVRYIGCSNYYGYQIADGMGVSARRGWAKFVVAQPLYNICNRDAELEVLPACKAHNVGVVSYSPLARGVLTGKYKPGEPFPEGSRAARDDPRMKQAELREESFVVAQELVPIAQRHGRPLSQFALAWALANPIITSLIIGPRTMAQYEDNLQALDIEVTPQDEAEVDALVPRGWRSTPGFTDVAYPVRGRPVETA